MRVYLFQEVRVLNMEILDYVMKKNNVSDIEIANLLSIDENTWLRKRINPNEIEIGEVEKIVEYLNLDNKIAKCIFLP